MKCLDICAPVTTKVMNRPPAPWITKDLKVLMQQGNQVQSRLKQDRTSTYLQNEYKTRKLLGEKFITVKPNTIKIGYRKTRQTHPISGTY